MKPDNFMEIQVLFLKWMRHHGVRSTDQIRVACKSLLIGFGMESKSSLFKILYPMVRKGLMEFAGEGNYKLTAPIILYYPNKKIAVAVNLSTKQKESIAEDWAEKEDDEYGVIRFTGDRKEVYSASHKIDSNYFEPNTAKLLKNFPRLSDVIFNQFEKAHINSNGEYYNVIKHKWTKDSRFRYGVFRLVEDAQKVYLKTEKDDYLIPYYKQNPEGRPLAETYQAINENIDFYQYNSQTKVLTISNINIPILLDRFLRLPSLYLHQGVLEDYYKTSYSNISPAVYKEIVRIFDK